MKRVPILLLVLILASFCPAEDAGTSASTVTEPSATAPVPENDPYAAEVGQLLEPISLNEDYDQGKLIQLELAKRHRDPTRAMVQSMLVPGWGQFYNNQPLKGFAAIIAEGLSGTLTIYNYGIMVKYDHKARDAYRLAKKYIDGGLNDLGDEQTQLGDQYDSRYRYFTIETEKNLWLCLGSIFLASLGAYINANLSDFDIYDLPRDPNVPQDLVIPIWGVSFTW